MAQTALATTAKSVPVASPNMKLVSVTYIGGTAVRNHATVVLAIDGQRAVFEQDANHALEAAFLSLAPIAANVSLVDYRVKKKGKGGASAEAQATVVLSRNNCSTKASATNPDTIIASVEAYVRALAQLP